MIYDVNQMGWTIPGTDIKIDLSESKTIRDQIRKGVDVLERNTGIDFGDILTRDQKQTTTQTTQQAQGWLNRNRNLVLTVVGVAGTFLLLRKW